MEPELINRKAISQLAPSLTVDMIRKNEKRLGLDKAKVQINKRLILYRRAQVFVLLRSAGLIA